jgi:transmembrane 9 superfamily protein 2/4
MRWWRAFGTGCSVALYIFLYAVWSFWKLEVGGVYYVWALVSAMGVGLISGTVSFLGCFWFVRKIYTTIKVD